MHRDKAPGRGHLWRVPQQHMSNGIGVGRRGFKMCHPISCRRRRGRRHRCHRPKGRRCRWATGGWTIYRGRRRRRTRERREGQKKSVETRDKRNLARKKEKKSHKLQRHEIRRTPMVRRQRRVGGREILSHCNRSAFPGRTLSVGTIFTGYPG